MRTTTNRKVAGKVMTRKRNGRIRGSQPMEREGVDKNSQEYLEAVGERDGLIRQREIAEIRVAFRNGLHAL